jgi:NAD(P)-dependent dehydrogenase (short-subunit alcohol dehydrogenase family)
MLTSSAAFELAPHKIRVNGIAPGITVTESNLPYMEKDPQGWQQMLDKLPLRRAGYPEDYAHLLCCWLLMLLAG